MFTERLKKLKEASKAGAPPAPAPTPKTGQPPFSSPSFCQYHTNMSEDPKLQGRKSRTSSKISIVSPITELMFRRQHVPDHYYFLLADVPHHNV